MVLEYSYKWWNDWWMISKRVKYWIIMDVLEYENSMILENIGGKII